MNARERQQDEEFADLLRRIDQSIVKMRTYREALERIAHGDAKPALTAALALVKGMQDG